MRWGPWHRPMSPCMPLYICPSRITCPSMSVLSGPLKYSFSKDWSKNRYFLNFKGLISQTDSATRNFRPVSIFWCSHKKRSKLARLRRPARVGNVTLPTPSQFLRHIWALPQTWSLPRDRYRLEISGPAFTSWKCWIPDPNLPFFASNLRKKIFERSA